MFNDLFRTRRFLYSIYLFPFQLASSNCAFTLNNILYCHGNATMRVVCYKTKHQIQIITKPLNLSLSLYRLHWLHPPNKVLVFLVQKKKEKTRGLQKEEISQLVVRGYIKKCADSQQWRWWKTKETDRSILWTHSSRVTCELILFL